MQEKQDIIEFPLSKVSQSRETDRWILPEGCEEEDESENDSSSMSIKLDLDYDSLPLSVNLLLGGLCNVIAGGISFICYYFLILLGLTVEFVFRLAHPWTIGWMEPIFFLLRKFLLNILQRKTRRLIRHYCAK